MELDNDFKEFLQLLNQYKVEFLIVGGYAVAFHGYPRYTGDFDIWINASGENADNLIRAVDAFGFETEGLQNLNFETETIAFHLGTPPIRIDIMNQISGVKFNECFSRRIVTEVNGVTSNYIGLPDLLKNKKASGRLKDLNDIENLQ
ncbi:hypothetical protein [Adhaeribacter pallidiroseus]|uniref:Uncharacterized protein n=1 Tax=Adhaeribacter pallidiroseus TaxID=2072847 RepID=A0A369QGT8_9BACT|nr:hypothetical protein [Adhaeribacter pallidiroseus]RDC61498.1 hypothetical protein AHMF7616_00077 [Adhaeribacter pallidiroseus]